MLWQYHQESSPHKSWTYQIHQCEAFCICALVLSRFSGTAFTGSQHDIWLEQSSDHIQNKKDLPTLERSTTVSFFLHAKLEVLRSFFPPFGEAMPSTKPDKNRMGLLKAHATTNAFIAPCTKHFTKVSHQFFLHTPQYTAGVLWGEASRWLQVQKIQGDRTKRRISTRKNWEATAGREGAWEVDSKKETV